MIDASLPTVLVYGHYDVQPPVATDNEDLANMADRKLTMVDGLIVNQ